MCGAGATNLMSSNSLQGQKVNRFLNIEFLLWSVRCSLNFSKSYILQALSFNIYFELGNKS